MDFVRFALRYAYSRRKPAGYIALCCLAYVIAFLICQLPLAALGYMILFSLVPVLVFEVFRLLRLYQKHLTMGDITEVNAKALDELAAQYPPEESILDEDYQALLRRCVASLEEAENAPSAGLGFAEYYTRWAREIKEPVSAMEQLLLTGDSPMVRRMSVELRHIAQYAEMAVVYARLEGGPGCKLQRYDLNAIVDKSLKKFCGEALEKGLALRFEPTTFPVMVVTDGKWLAFVLERILSNALKYTFSGGVTVSVEREAVTPDDTADWKRVSMEREAGLSEIGPFLLVRDRGTGIAPEKLVHLLDPEPIRNGAEESAGLGLYLCRRICERLGHTMSITSREGEGTLVTLDLSLGLASLDEAERKAEASPDREPGGPERAEPGDAAQTEPTT